MYNSTFDNSMLFTIFNSQVVCANLNFTQNVFYLSEDFLIVLEKNSDITFKDLFLEKSLLKDSMFVSISETTIVHFSNFLIENNTFSQFFSIQNSEKIFLKNLTFYKIQISKEINDKIGIFELFFCNFVLIEQTSLIQSISKENSFLGYIFAEISAILINEILIFNNSGNYSEDFLLIEVGIGINIKSSSKGSSTLEIKNSLFLSNSIISNEEFLGIAAPCGVIRLPQSRVLISLVFFENNLSTDYSTCLVITANSLSIKSSLFRNNSALKQEFLEKTSLSGTLIRDFFEFYMENSTFLLNQANFGTSLQMIVNSIYNPQILFVQKTRFLLNYAYDSSNVLHIFSNRLSRLVIFEECDFIKGKSDGLSGLFFFGTHSGPFFQKYTFSFCNFIENIGSYFGSIIEHYPANPNNCFISFYYCFFLSNKLSNMYDSATVGLLIDVWGEAISEDPQNFAIFTNECYFSGIIFL